LLARRQEDRAPQIVEIEEGLRLQVVELGLKGSIETRQAAAARQQHVAALEHEFEFSDLLGEQLDAIQVGGREFRIGLDGALELVEGLVDAALVPQDLAATVAGLGAGRVRLQRLVQPGESFFDAPAM